MQRNLEWGGVGKPGSKGLFCHNQKKTEDFVVASKEVFITLIC